MWRSASSSERRLSARALLGSVGLMLALTAPAPARVLLTQSEALDLVFEGASVERTSLFLTEAELRRASELAGVEVTSALVVVYSARRDGEMLGTAYFDSHRVRTLPETLMLVVGPDHRVRRIELLAFKEPPEYLPRPAWYAQFIGKALDADLALKRSIQPVAGATLTARATEQTVRRLLAIHRVIDERTRADETASETRRP